jgi:hypothetical protein
MRPSAEGGSVSRAEAPALAFGEMNLKLIGFDRRWVRTMTDCTTGICGRVSQAK